MACASSSVSPSARCTASSIGGDDMTPTVSAPLMSPAPLPNRPAVEPMFAADEIRGCSPGPSHGGSSGRFRPPPAAARPLRGPPRTGAQRRRAPDWPPGGRVPGVRVAGPPFPPLRGRGSGADTTTPAPAVARRNATGCSSCSPSLNFGRRGGACTWRPKRRCELPSSRDRATRSPPTWRWTTWTSAATSSRCRCPTSPSVWWCAPTCSSMFGTTPAPWRRSGGCCGPGSRLVHVPVLASSTVDYGFAVAADNGHVPGVRPRRRRPVPRRGPRRRVAAGQGFAAATASGSGLFSEDMLLVGRINEENADRQKS